ncbi:MAG: hypothetical protein EI684_05115 [Candidatus Viridilinea halotolerans]|uniref:Uncharacterized protein n=1 Tax=Candidatus Viridilinea halotolerans TaxID=2491704 RepID=A0A426U5Q4_9CHLR|nr:MAG: hypothetical protein EI684_05115 [Candidatus Viridilinea halotolerans]
MLLCSCSSVLLFSCSSVLLFSCSSVLLFFCSSVLLFFCSFVLLLFCSSALPLFRSPYSGDSMRTLTIHLAERTYEVPQASIARARAWRQQIQTEFTGIIALVRGEVHLDLNNVDDLAAVLERVMPLLLNALDTVRELLYSYAPSLRADAAHIEEYGYDDEIIEAFLVAVQATFPLDRFTKLLGPMSPAILSNSPGLRGASSKRS